jgi:outer membrane lipoprotein SlyB
MFKMSHFNVLRVVTLLLSGVCFAGMSGNALAQSNWSSDPHARPGTQDAKARYEADKKLCADEASPEARLQCRRDAQSVYDKAMAGTKPGVYQTQPTVCVTCGRVSAVTVSEKAGDSNAVGMIAGGVAGAVLGRQVGGGLGKDLATIAGAAGGAYAGKRIQESMNTAQVWVISVKYPDGRVAQFEFANDPGFKVGDSVKNSGHTVVRH